MEDISSILSIISGFDSLMRFGHWYTIGACLLACGFTGIIIFTLVQGLQGRIPEGSESWMSFVALGLILAHAVVGAVLAQAFTYRQTFHPTPIYSVVLLLADVVLLISFSFPERSSKATLSSAWTILLTIGIAICTAVSIL